MADATDRHREQLLKSDYVYSSFWYAIEYHREYLKKSMDDVVVSRYLERIAAGEIIINPLSFTVETIDLPDDLIAYQPDGHPSYPVSTNSSSSALWLRGCVGYVPQSYMFPPARNGSLPGPPCVDIDLDKEIDLRKQLSLAFVDKPQYDFGEDLAEIGETIKFIRRPLQSLIVLFKSFKKKASRVSSSKQGLLNAVERSKALAGVWASYSFAAAPLIRSIDNALDALEDKSTLNLRRTSRSKDDLTDIASETVSGSHSSGNSASCLITNSREVSLHAGVIYDAPQRGDLISKLGLRNKDLAVTAWEVVPMSFMLDRVISVKNALASIINLIDPNVEIKGAFSMTREKHTHTVLQTSCSGNPGVAITTFAPLPHVHEYFTMSREEWIPNITTSLPLLNPKELINSASKTADLAALVTLQIAPLLKDFILSRR
jgi:hypothetical protein